MGCKAICCCLSHLAGDCNGELMFGSAAKGGITETLKRFLPPGWKQRYSPCHKAEKRNLSGSGKSLSHRPVVDLLPVTMSTVFFVCFFSPPTVFTHSAIGKQLVVHPVQGQALLWYCQDAETLLTYIPGSCPTLAVAVAQWVCLIRLAYKSNTDDYLPPSDVIKC